MQMLNFTNEIFNKNTSLFENTNQTTNPQTLMIKEVLTNIKNGTYKESVLKARQLRNTDKKKYDDFKKNSLIGFTMSEHCNHRKSDLKTTKDDLPKLIYHTNLLQIDIDILPDGLTISDVRNKIDNDRFTLFSFISPSGVGLKVGIIIDGNNHLESFKQAEQYYLNTYNLQIDEKVKNKFRLCFVSYDENLFINNSAEIFTITEKGPIKEKEVLIKLTKLQNTKNTVSADDRFKNESEKAIETAKKMINNSIKGSRHNERIKAGELLGGFVGGGCYSKDFAMNEIKSTVMRNTDLSIEKAMKDILDGIEYGMTKPFSSEQKESERQEYLKRNSNQKSNRNNSNSKTIQSVNKETGEISEVTIPFVFWFEMDGRNKEILLKIEYTKLYDYLKFLGIKKIVIDEKELKRILVRVTDNVVSEIDIPEIQNIVKKYVDSLPEYISENKTKKDLKEIIGKGINNYINENEINFFLDFVRIEFLQDDKDKSFFFYQNGFIEVSKDYIQLKSYKQLSGFIWKSQIIKHNISVIPDNDIDVIDNFEFVKFTQNTCTIKEPHKLFDAQRYKSLLSTIGYLLHNYKTTSNKFAVIFTESNVSDEPQGRTGKGLLMQSINKIRKLTTIDGKNFDFKTQFAFQVVELDTQILFFDDVKKYFDFQSLFSAITEGLSFEKKNKDRINLSAEKSPKIVISTNYSIQGNSESDKGRKFEMELLCYYNSKFKPIDDFGNEFFHTWNAEQWNIFYNFMFTCSQIYFENNCIIPEYSSETIDEKKLLNATSQDFLEFVNTIQKEVYLSANEVYSNYIKFYDIDKKDLTQTRFTKWLKEYCKQKNIHFEAKPKTIQGTTERMYYLKDVTNR